MKRLLWCLALPLLGLGAVAALPAPLQPTYVKKANRIDTIVASLEASGVPSLRGPWYVIGLFDNPPEEGFDQVNPPEREIDLTKTYPGKEGQKCAWKEVKNFELGKIHDITKHFPSGTDFSTVYFYHEVTATEAVALPVGLGSDDGIAVFLNGKRVFANNAVRGAVPDQDETVLNLQPGKNRLLIKVTNAAGNFAVYVAPRFPEKWPAKLRQQLDSDFPEVVTTAPQPGATSAEGKHYRIVTLPVPKECVLEVGGLAMRPDGSLLACTRRGEVWLVTNPAAEDPADVGFKLFATGMHEALGIRVDPDGIFVAQRPELTKLVTDKAGDTVKEYTTVCDKWGVSGDYHEFAFGPARDKAGNFYVTLNVGFGGGHQSKAPWRGWCVKITPKGELIPWATGLRSPNGIAFAPDGSLFYADNQGEWVATCKLQEIREGEYYGHPAGLRWVKQSPFADSLKESYPSGMWYDGQKGGFPQHTQPAVWFPYGRMGQSASEPIWDTTGGKFGPFAGQCFIGDQTKSVVMRVSLQKVNGRFQGACYPFRSGFECGVNRLCYGPDGSLYVGMTNRGWGSVGGKPYGLQRLVYTGVLPFEVHEMTLTRAGFDLTFTKPLDKETAKRLAAYALQSFTHNYWGTYGSPEVDRKAEKVDGVTVSDDGKKVSLSVDGLKRGRIYELHLDGVKSTDGDALLHADAYYTLNDFPK